MVDGARPSARIEASQRLELLGRRALDGLVGERAQRVEVSTVGVDGARRSPSLEGQQEAYDVGVGSTHGARPDSAGGAGSFPEVSPRPARPGCSDPRFGARRRARRAHRCPSASVVADSVVAYPSSQSISARGRSRAAGDRYVAYEHRDRRARGRDRRRARREARLRRSDDATRGAARRPPLLRPLRRGEGDVGARMRSSRGTGAERATERPNQPIHVQVDVPVRDASPDATRGPHGDRGRSSHDGAAPVRVFPVTLPRPGTRVGNLLTSFNLSPKSYVAKSAQLYGFSSTTSESRRTTLSSSSSVPTASRRGRGGSASRRSPAGLRVEPEVVARLGRELPRSVPRVAGFLGTANPDLEQPRRRAALHRAAQPVPARELVRVPAAACTRSGPRTRCSVPRRCAYVFGYDEPGLSGQRVVARQAKVVHDCFPGGGS